MKIIGYTRVSTTEQGVSGLGLDAQTRRITDAAERRAWDVEWKQDVGSGSEVNGGLREALELLRTRQADGLVVAKMDRIARSVLNAVDIMQTAQEQGWSLIVLDLDIDLTTPAGEAMFHMLATFAQFERRMISQRTKDALAARKAQGKPVGRPSKIPAEVRRRIVEARNDGSSFERIAADLTGDGILTPTGRKVWSEATCRRAFNSTVGAAS